MRDEEDERYERYEKDERDEVDETVVQQAVEMRSHATPKLGSVRLPLRPPLFRLASSPLRLEVNIMQLATWKAHSTDRHSQTLHLLPPPLLLLLLQ